MKASETVVTASPSPGKVDLNTADSTELTRLAGIGPTLAQRILDYRQARGPFLAVEELIAVPGIGPKVFARLAEQITVSVPPLDFTAEVLPAETPPSTPSTMPATPPETLPQAWTELEAPSAAEERLAVASENADVADLLAPTPAAAADDTPPLLVETTTSSEPAPSPASPPEGPSAPHRESPPPLPASAPSSPPLEAAPPRPPSSHRKAPPAPRRSGWSWLGWMSAVFLGSILGLLFTLLVLHGINGTLSIHNHPAIIELRNQTADLAARQDSLRNEIGGLRQRLDRLETLTTRMERAEAALTALQQDVETLHTETAALQANIEALAEEIAAIEARTAKAELFFQRLQALLAEIFSPEAPASPTPMEQEVEP